MKEVKKASAKLRRVVHWLLTTGNLFRVLAERFVRDRFTYSAAALTFTTLLAIVPLMAIGLTILSAFPVFHDFKGDVQAFVFSNFVPAAGETVQSYLSGFAAQTTKLSIAGTIFLFVTAVMMMLTIERALNDVWLVKYRRRGIAAWLRYWAILSLAPIFVGISLAATSYVVSLPFIVEGAKTIGATEVLVGGVPFVLMVLAFMLLYAVIPNCRVPWRYALIGALVAGILFEIAKKLFIYYLTNFPTYQVIYGAMASVPIFLIWLYFSWVIVLFGALISNVLATKYFERRGGRIDPFMHAFLWVGSLWHAQQSGRSLTLSHLYRLTPGYYEIQPEMQMQKLIKARLVTMTDHSSYTLARDLSHMTLSELYNMLPWKLSYKADVKDAQMKAFAQLLGHAHENLAENLNVPLGELYEKIYHK